MQGSAAIFARCKRLKIKETDNRIFCLRGLIHAMDGINQSFLGRKCHGQPRRKHFRCTQRGMADSVLLVRFNQGETERDVQAFATFSHWSDSPRAQRTSGSIQLLSGR